VVSNPSNVAYLTGFDGVFDGWDAHVVVIDRERSVLYTDTRYWEEMSTAAKGSEWELRCATDGLYEMVCDDLARELPDATVALEASVPYGRFKFISEKLGGRVEVVDQWVERIRQVKEPEEIARISAAQELTDRVFTHVLEFVRPGLSELEIALELEFFMRKEGSEGVAFAPIVASGPNSAHPHATVTSRTVEMGDFLKLDFGARLGGYCSDMTRTVVIGPASARQREIYQVVLAANRAGLDAVRPGVPGRAVDEAARTVIREAGMGDLFGHGLGHGVGMDVHELPSVSSRGSAGLHVGNVITIEPGVYVPGFGGVRIEDLVVVEESGARVLTGSTKELLEL
jgi:Xaa-Pro aminopeptidase